MLELANRVLYVGEPDAQVVPERALVESGIGLAKIAVPETAVSYVRDKDVKLVLLDDTFRDLDLSHFAGSLKVACPSLKIIAMVSSGNLRYVDTILEKPFQLEALLKAMRHNLAEWC